MDWSRTKSIFISVFFVLNVFLTYQYLEKMNNYQYDYITDSSIEEFLKEENITYSSLPKQKIRDQLLIAESKVFDKKTTKTLMNQNVKIIDGTKLLGIFKEPLTISENFQSSELEILIKDHLYKGSEYSFWSYDEMKGMIVFYQTWEKKMFFNNSKGKITLYLNEDGNVTSYEQTYLTEIEKFNKEKELVTAIKAIEALYNKGDLVSNSNLEVQLGYYNTLQTASVTHLLVPTWRVVVNEELDLFVNAIDGGVIELNTEEKILE